jgi:predicted protein tyrosine phosphatase
VQIRAISRRNMIAMVEKNPNIADRCFIISIGDPDDDLVFETEHPRVLSLRFHDHCDSELSFADEHAEAILDFLEQVENSDLIVHCGAGVSRSGAVAEFAAEYFRQKIDPREFTRNNSQIMPNQFVKKILVKQWNARTQKEN